MKRFFALIITMIFSAVLLGGCNDKDSSSNVKQEDMEYGATMRQIIDSKIDLLFDGRFLTDEEMYAVADYYYAIQTNDAELFESTQPKYYIEFLKEKSGQEVSDFISEIAEETIASLGENYQFTLIEATECGGSDVDSAITEITEMMNGIYEEKGAEKSFEDTLNEAKYVKLDLSACPDGDENNIYSYTDKIVYIFNCEDGIYILD